MRFSSVTSVGRRILGVNSAAMHRSGKNGERHERRSKGTRSVLVAVAYKYRDPLGEICIPKSCDSRPPIPSPPYLISLTRHSSTLSFFSALRYRHIPLSLRWFSSVTPSLRFTLLPCVHRAVLTLSAVSPFLREILGENNSAYLPYYFTHFK